MSLTTEAAGAIVGRADSGGQKVLIRILRPTFVDGQLMDAGDSGEVSER